MTFLLCRTNIVFFLILSGKIKTNFDVFMLCYSIFKVLEISIIFLIVLKF